MVHIEFAEQPWPPAPLFSDARVPGERAVETQVTVFHLLGGRVNAITQLMLKVFVVQDGVGMEYWTVGLDGEADQNETYVQEADRAFQVAAIASGIIGSRLQTRHGSIDSPYLHFSPSLIDAIRQVDEGRNVFRQNFDVVTLVGRPYMPVIAVAIDEDMRDRAAKLALSCRLMFEESLGLLTEYNGFSTDMDVDVSITRFDPIITRSVNDQSENTSEPMFAPDGVWGLLSDTTDGATATRTDGATRTNAGHHGLE